MPWYFYFSHVLTLFTGVLIVYQILGKKGGFWHSINPFVMLVISIVAIAINLHLIPLTPELLRDKWLITHFFFGGLYLLALTTSIISGLAKKFRIGLLSTFSRPYFHLVSGISMVVFWVLSTGAAFFIRSH